LPDLRKPVARWRRISPQNGSPVGDSLFDIL
jgi:hypothetical protein